MPFQAASHADRSDASAGLERLLPSLVVAGAALRGELAVGVNDIRRCPERLVGNAENRLRGGDILGRERVAVGFVVVGPLRRGLGDVRPQDQQARSVFHRLGGEQRFLEGIAVVGDLAEVLDVPAVGLEALTDVVGRGELRRSVDRDAVVVENDVEATEAEMPGERRRLVAHAFHQAAVSGDRPDVMIDQRRAEAVAQHALGHRHAHGVAEALAERTGGDLDAGSVTGLGMSRGARPERAECLEVVELQAVATEVEHRVLKDRGVAVGEDEPVAVRPFGIERVVAHHPAVEHVGEWSERHRRSLMATLGVERGIHRQPAGEGNGAGLEVGCECRRHHPDPIPGGADHSSESAGWQQRERDDEPRTAVDATVGEHLAIVGELQLATYEAVGELAWIDGERADVAGHLIVVRRWTSGSPVRRNTTSRTPWPGCSGGQ